MSELVFREEDHTYWLGSQEIPGVTRVLADLVSDFAKDSWAAERGKVVHQACALFAEGCLDLATVDERIAGYVLSYRKLLDHTGWIAKAVERKLFDSDLLYAGTFDVAYNLELCFDIKTRELAPWHQLQTSAYQRLGGYPRRGCIYLQADGSIAKLKEHKDRNDWKYFQSFLNVYHWKEQHNLNGKS